MTDQQTERRLVSREDIRAALGALDMIPDKTALDDHIPNDEWERLTLNSQAAAIFAALPQPATEPALDVYSDPARWGERLDAAQPSAEVERLRVPLAEFTDANAATMLARLHHGAEKFGETSWRDDLYLDEDNLARLNRAVDHLVAALHSGAGPEEAQKRAADVANQAFMFADPLRKRALAESDHE